MDINDLCFYITQDESYECKILDKKEEYGPSIKNHLLQTMDLVLTTYYKIEYKGNEIWVTSSFLRRM